MLCPNWGFRIAGRRIGRCLISADQLHDWSLAGCTSQNGYPDVEVACPTGPHHDCTPYGPAYRPIRCTRTNTTAVDDGNCGRDYGTCGSVHAACNGSGFCVVPRGAEPGPLCETQRRTPARFRNGTATVLSFDGQDPSCMDIYTNTATPHDSGVVLFFPSAFQHMDLAGDPAPHNDGLVDIRFGSARSVLDNISYPPTRNGRAPFVPVGVNSCPALVLANVDSPQRIDWCRNSAANLNETAIDAGTKYMASGYVVSPDGTQLSLYSGGVPATHGGGGVPGGHSGIKRHVLRQDGFVGLEAGYFGAHAPSAQWPQMLTVPLAMPDASLCTQLGH